jgi:hypothetical protein
MDNQNTAGVDLDKLNEHADEVYEKGLHKTATDIRALINLARRAEPSVTEGHEHAQFVRYALAGDYWPVEAFERNEEGMYIDDDVHAALVRWGAAPRAALASPAVSQPRVTEQADGRVRFDVKSIDTPEFRKLCDAYHCASQTELEDAYEAIYQHVDEETADLSHNWQARAALTQQAAPEAPANAWHDAILAECMRVESCYHADDPVRTIKELINWYSQEASSVAEGIKIMADNYMRETCGAPAAQQAGAAVDGTVTDYGTPAATTASAAHHFACPQRGYNPLCKGCEAEREATTASADHIEDARAMVERRDRADEGKILRRIVNALRIENDVPADDAALRDRLFLVLRRVARAVEQRATTASASQPKQMPWEPPIYIKQSERAPAPSRDAAPMEAALAACQSIKDSETSFEFRAGVTACMNEIRAALARAPLPAQGVINGDQLAALIHYPECWDTAAYPNLADALREIVTMLKCSECYAAPAQAGDALDAAPLSEAWIMTELERIVTHPERLTSGDYASAIKLVRAAMSASQGHRNSGSDQ